MEQEVLRKNDVCFPDVLDEGTIKDVADSKGDLLVWLP